MAMSDADSLMSYLFYIDPLQSSAFGLYVQLADEVLIPLLDHNAYQPMTIIVPNNDAFEAFIVENGGNSSDPDTLTTPEWKARWNNVFEYFCIFFLHASGLFFAEFDLTSFLWPAQYDIGF